VTGDVNPAQQMIRIRGLFEAHLTVRDYERSITFYRDVIGLEVGLEQPERPAAFFWVGGRGRSMLGLFASASAGRRPTPHHVAFELTLEDLLAALKRLQFASVAAFGASREPITEPIVFPWMPAASLFFEDPDGNVLEFIAMLSDPPLDRSGPISWREWQASQQTRHQRDLQT
jgi:lactoylglutathione lyase